MPPSSLHHFSGCARNLAAGLQRDYPDERVEQIIPEMHANIRLIAQDPQHVLRRKVSICLLQDLDSRTGDESRDAADEMMSPEQTASRNSSANASSSPPSAS